MSKDMDEFIKGILSRVHRKESSDYWSDLESEDYRSVDDDINDQMIDLFDFGNN